MFMKQLDEVETKRFGKIFINLISIRRLSIKHKITNRTRTTLRGCSFFNRVNYVIMSKDKKNIMLTGELENKVDKIW